MANLLLIRDLCKKKGVTIRELANRVGIGESALQALIKNGSTNTSTLEKISNELEVSPGIFFEVSPKFSIDNVSGNSNSPIGNTTIGDNNFYNAQPPIEMVIKEASYGYQSIIRTYQEHSDRLLNIIDKLTDKYG
jgi:transcriptional regulator with XRE-family HTH domain